MIYSDKMLDKNIVVIPRDHVDKLEVALGRRRDVKLFVTYTEKTVFRK